MASLPRAFGSYVLLSELGRGGMGQVFLARPMSSLTGIPSPVVIKTLLAQFGASPEFVQRFRHEALIATALESPHVATVFDAGQVGDTLYIAMEHIDGWPLSKVLEELRQSGEQTSIPGIIDLSCDLLTGLDALHSAKDANGQPLKAVHRDVSPKNLMLGEDGRGRLIDLGIGKSRLLEWKTQTGAVFGSPGYMAPEQIAGGTVDQRTDLYAFGTVLFELLTLQPYVPLGPVSMMLRASLNPTLRPISTLRADAPEALDPVLAKALSLDPAARFSSAKEMIEALRAACPMPATRVGAPGESLLNASLLDELGALKTEVSRQVTDHELASFAAEETTTTSFARRPGVAAAHAPPTDRIDRGPVAPTRRVHSRQHSQASWLERNRTPLAMAMLLPAVLVLGMVLEHQRSAPEPVRIDVEPSLPRAADPPPAPAIIPREAPPPAPPAPPPLEVAAPSEPEPNKPTRARPSPPPPKQAETSPAPPAAQKDEAVEAMAERLLARAMKERRRRLEKADPAAAPGALDPLLTELQEIMAAPRGDTARARTRALADRLTQLEARPGS